MISYLRLLLNLDRSYLILAILRIVLTCLPQVGYIHPDEFFQSIEIIAENTFQVEVNKPWEYNATFPVRSVTPPYLTTGMSLQLLKGLHVFIWSYFRISVMTPYFILLFPRLLICCISFIVDWSLYRICLANSEKYKSRQLILSMSYVMFTYGTRTFSNTIELVLFSLLLYFVSESVIFSTINVRQREYINIRYKKAETIVDKAKFHKLKLFLEDDSLRNCFAIATITVAGFFNRPTFVAYAITPVFFWLYRGLGFKSVNSLNFHWRIIVFILCTIPTIILFIMIDSFYFGYLTWGEMGMLEISINNFVATPWNFIKYNINPKNLAEHGLHPRYLHAAINMPLLFNILVLLGYSNFLDLFSCLVKAKFNYLPTVRSIKGLMTGSILTPLAILSIFPHQEPRFLIPLALPLVYLYGAKVLPESDSVIVKSYKVIRSSQKKKQESYFLFKVWIALNAILTVFYGFIHQGGIYPFISHLSTEMKVTDYRTSYHVITSHIYSIPQSLFLQRMSPYDVSAQPKRLFFYEEGSRHLTNVLESVLNTLNRCEKSSSKCKVYLVIPNSLIDDLEYNLYKKKDSLSIKNTISFHPHLSIEAPPSSFCLGFDRSYQTLLTNPISSLSRFLKCFGLSRIEFVLNNR